MSNRFSRDHDAEPDELEPEASVTVYRDGPLIVRGPVKFLDQDGNEIAVNRKVVALCRCGKSRMKPLCDGTHKVAGFKAPSTLTRVGEAAREATPREHATPPAVRETA